MYNWYMIVLLFMIWGLFLLLAPTIVVYIVALGISGWQVGSWIEKLTCKID